jgi:RHS repeat-associated protein
MNVTAWMRHSVLALGLVASVAAQAQTLVGRTVGEAGVSATGAARYVVPLVLPPGTNGLAPSLAIAYDSRGGNGLLGAGFHLAGFSTIERCARTLAQDGVVGGVALDFTDRYCLDGKRLRVTSGTYGSAGSQYQTEVEEFSRVTAIGQAGNGPASFRVEASEGLTYEYGATTDSRIESTGSATPRTWALSRVLDRSGNTIDFFYAEDSAGGGYRPLRIDYTGNTQVGTPAYYAVRFYYELRPAADVLSGYQAGATITESLRLDRIDVQHYGSSTVVRSFDVSYAPAGPSGRSRLASVQECSGAECLPATTFSWTYYGAGWGWWDVNLGLSASTAATALPGDMDGDGCEDLTYFDSVAGRWQILRGSTIGYVGPAISVGPATITTAADAISIDVDGDGRRDVFVPGYALTTGSAWQWLHHVGGASYALSATNIAKVSAPGGAMAVDIDGDGREDLVYIKTSTASIFWRRNLTAAGVPAFAPEAVLWTSPEPFVAASRPFGTNPQRFRSIVRRGDFNGDGRGDLLFLARTDCGTSPDCSTTRSQWHALISQGTSLATRAILDTAGAPLLGDFNGDGLTDVTHAVQQSDGTLKWQVRFGTGAPMTSTAQFSEPVGTSIDAIGSGAMVVDWDGDGRTDLLYPSGLTEWRYCRSSGTTLEACQPATFSLDNMTGAPLVTDVNGDGLVDIVYPAGNWHYRLHLGDQPDVLAAATDGLGNVARFTYSTLADPGVYTPGIGAIFPVRGFVVPLPVVSRLTQSDGSGGSFTTSMTYESARMHVQGRGFLGFARRTAVDSRTGLARVDEMLQDPSDFDFVGRPSVITVRQSNGTPLNRATFSWSRFAYGAGYDSRRFPYISSLVADRFELDGTRVSSSATRNTYDAFGTLTDRLTTVTEIAHGSNPGAQHIDRVSLSGVVNDSTNWCLGRPASVVVSRSHTLAGGTAITRTTDHAWDYARCRQSQSTAEPAIPALRVVTGRTYDSYGNVSTEAVTPASQPMRRTTYTWSDAGRFLGSVEAPESYRVTASWNPVTAQRIEVRDSNDLVMRWSHDAFGRVARQTGPDGASATFTRMPCDGTNCEWAGARYRIRRTTLGPVGAYVRSDDIGYDSLDREVYARNEQPGGAFSLRARRYDSRGLLSQESLPAACCSAPASWAAHTHDLLGRRIATERATSESVPSVIATRWRYDGLNVTQVDALDRTTTLRRDAVGHVLQVVDSAGADTDYEYDAFGDLAKVRDYAGNETTIGHNVRGFRTSVADPDAGAWTYEYSALGELLRQTNARGQTTRYTYDLLGRPTTRTEAEGLTAWTWGHSSAARNVGVLSEVTSPGFQETYVYDSLGRLRTSSRAVAGTTLATNQTYDSATGMLDTLIYPALPGTTPLRLKHSYDRGELVRLADADVPATVFWQLDSVNAAGQVTGATLGNGIKVASRYDAVTGLLESRTAGLAGSAAYQNLRYAWDSVGNLSERADDNRGIAEQFSYDSRGTTILDLAYDDIGNITYKSDIGNYRYDPVHRHAVAAAGSNSYAYDANGAVTNASGSSIAWYSYDLPGQIAHPNGNSSAFYYGADRSRYRQVARAGTTLTDRLYAADGSYERYSTGGVTGERSYVVADGAVVAVRSRVGSDPATTVYLLHDHLNGLDGFTSSSGALLAKTSYSPFGSRRSGDWLSAAPAASEWQQIQSTTARGYTGHEHLDNLGIIHMNGRVFDPVLGRFLSPDPYVQAPYDTQGLNRYSYVRNNPLRYTDPSGYCFNDHPAADQSALWCMEQIIVNATGIDSFTADLLAASDHAMSAMNNFAEAGAVGGVAGDGAQLEEVLVTGSMDDRPDMFAVDASLYAQYPQWLTRNFSDFIMYAGLTVGALIEPTPIGEAALAAELAADGSAAASIDSAFHYTFRRFLTSIRTNGLRPGSYATTNGRLSPLQAQIDLALPPTRGLTETMIRIDVAGMRRAGYEIPELLRIPRSTAMPGGGFEMQFPYSVPPEFITVFGP